MKVFYVMIVNSPHDYYWSKFFEKAAETKHLSEITCLLKWLHQTTYISAIVLAHRLQVSVFSIISNNVWIIHVDIASSILIFLKLCIQTCQRLAAYPYWLIWKTE